MAASQIWWEKLSKEITFIKNRKGFQADKLSGLDINVTGLETCPKAGLNVSGVEPPCFANRVLIN